MYLNFELPISIPDTIDKAINNVNSRYYSSNNIKPNLTQSKILKGRQTAINDFIPILDKFDSFEKFGKNYGLLQSNISSPVTNQDYTQIDSLSQIRSRLVTNIQTANRHSISSNRINTPSQITPSSVQAEHASFDSRFATPDAMSNARRLQLFRRLRLTESARRGRSVSNAIRRSRRQMMTNLSLNDSDSNDNQDLQHGLISSDNVSDSGDLVPGHSSVLNSEFDNVNIMETPVESGIVSRLKNNPRKDVRNNFDGMELVTPQFSSSLFPDILPANRVPARPVRLRTNVTRVAGQSLFKRNETPVTTQLRNKTLSTDESLISNDDQIDLRNAPKTSKLPNQHMLLAPKRITRSRIKNKQLEIDSDVNEKVLSSSYLNNSNTSLNPPKITNNSSSIFNSTNEDQEGRIIMSESLNNDIIHSNNYLEAMAIEETSDDDDF